MSYVLYVSNKLVGVIEADRVREVNTKGVTHFYQDNTLVATIDTEFVRVEEMDLDDRK